MLLYKLSVNTARPAAAATLQQGPALAAVDYDDETSAVWLWTVARQQPVVARFSLGNVLLLYEPVEPVGYQIGAAVRTVLRSLDLGLVTTQADIAVAVGTEDRSSGIVSGAVLLRFLQCQTSLDRLRPALVSEEPLYHVHVLPLYAEAEARRGRGRSSTTLSFRCPDVNVYAQIDQLPQ